MRRSVCPTKPYMLTLRHVTPGVLAAWATQTGRTWHPMLLPLPLQVVSSFHPTCFWPCSLACCSMLKNLRSVVTKFLHAEELCSSSGSMLHCCMYMSGDAVSKTGWRSQPKPAHSSDMSSVSAPASSCKPDAVHANASAVCARQIAYRHASPSGLTHAAIDPPGRSQEATRPCGHRTRRTCLAHGLHSTKVIDMREPCLS